MKLEQRKDFRDQIENWGIIQGSLLVYSSVIEF